ncbi:MAG TPA: alpha/beta hydrolase [Rhizobiales bacterium]|nr:alpha/beta hydrolase [Hyphomicrobiales bacterium]
MSGKQLASVTGNPVPQGLRCGEITTPDGKTLRYALCCDGPGTRGTVCIFQGRSEYIEKYYETIRDLKARGFAVALFDWRGQGRSERLLSNRRYGHVKKFADYETDLAAFMTGVVLPDCPPPYFGLAHSMGGTVLLQALTRRTWFSACVLSAPMIDLVTGKFPAGLVRTLSGAMSTIGFSRLPVPFVSLEKNFRGNVLTHDRNRFEREKRMLAENSDLGIGPPTWGWLHGAINANERLGKMRGKDVLRAPVMLVAAGDDKVVSSQAIRDFSCRVDGAPSVVIDNAAHELLMETDALREQFWAAFDSFISNHTGSGA